MMIKYRHYRAIEEIDTPSGVSTSISCRGGATLAYTEDVDKDGKKFYAGSVAWCNPKDNYNRKYGRAKSAGFLNQNAQTGCKLTDGQRHWVSYTSMASTDFLSFMDQEMFAIAEYEPR